MTDILIITSFRLSRAFIYAQSDKGRRWLKRHYITEKGLKLDIPLELLDEWLEDVAIRTRRNVLSIEVLNR